MLSKPAHVFGKRHMYHESKSSYSWKDHFPTINCNKWTIVRRPVTNPRNRLQTLTWPHLVVSNERRASQNAPAYSFWSNSEFLFPIARVTISLNPMNKMFVKLSLHLNPDHLRARAEKLKKRRGILVQGYRLESTMQQLRYREQSFECAVSGTYLADYLIDVVLPAEAFDHHLLEDSIIKKIVEATSPVPNCLGRATLLQEALENSCMTDLLTSQGCALQPEQRLALLSLAWELTIVGDSITVQEVKDEVYALGKRKAITKEMFKVRPQKTMLSLLLRKQCCLCFWARGRI